MQRASARQSSELLFVNEFEVRINRKNVKHVRMRVAPPDGHIEVSVPLHVSKRKAIAFVREKRAWVLRQQQKLANSPQVKAARATEEEKRDWAILIAALVPPLIEHWEPVLGVRAGKLVFRNMRSQWGSCQPATGRICINTRLALYPPECLEYVVVHELCHLRERGHGPQFWALVESCLPNYREAKKLLRA